MNIKYIRVASDLHLEAFTGRDAETLAIDFIPKDDRDAESVLVLAGDISSVPSQLIGFIKALVDRFAHILYVPGNHEYYRHNYDAWNRKMTEDFAEYLPSVYAAFGDVRTFIVDNKLRFIAATLWSDGGPTLGDQGQVGYYLNDFRLIQRESSYQISERFTVQDMVKINKEHRSEIEKVLEQPFDGKTIVVSHHLPSRRLVSARFWPTDGSDGANGGFACNFDNVLAKTEIAPWLWIHGHTHDTLDTMLWDTRIVCNPAGYRGEWVNGYNTFMSDGGGSKQSVVVPKFVDV